MAGIKYKFQLVILFVISLLALSACSNAVKDTLKNEILDVKAARISEETPSVYCIDKNSSVVLILTESMNPDTVKFSGSIFEDSKTIKWSKTNKENDTVIFVPKNCWNEDSDLEDGDKASLYLNGKSKQGYDSKYIEWLPVITDGVIYVDEKSSFNADNSDYKITGAGSAANPMPDLPEAIGAYKTFYSAKGTGEIHIRSGYYSSIYNNSNNVVDSEESLIIKGGYDSSDWSVQNSEKNTTLLRGIWDLPNGDSYPCTFCVMSKGKLYLDGVTVYSSIDVNKIYSYGIYGFENSVVEINNSCIYAYTDSTCNTIKMNLGIATSGNLKINNSRINVISKMIEVDEKSSLIETAVGVLVSKSENAEITNSIIDLSNNNSKGEFGILIKDTDSEACIDVINCVLLNGKPLCDGWMSALIGVNEAYAVNICSNTFGFNCGYNSASSDISYYGSNGIFLPGTNSWIENCSGNIFYNCENDGLDLNEKMVFGIQASDYNDIVNCNNNCFAGTGTVVFYDSESTNWKYLTEDGLSEYGIGFYLDDFEDAALSSWNENNPLKPTSNTDSRILNSSLSAVVKETDILGNARTAPYTLGAYEID